MLGKELQQVEAFPMETMGVIVSVVPAEAHLDNHSL